MLARLIAWLGEPVQPIVTGYQPRDTGPQAPPPRGGASAMPKRNGVREYWFTEIPQTTMDIPMPAGTVPPRRVPCPCCGR